MANKPDSKWEEMNENASPKHILYTIFAVVVLAAAGIWYAGLPG